MSKQSKSPYTVQTSLLTVSEAGCVSLEDWAREEAFRVKLPKQLQTYLARHHSLYHFTPVQSEALEELLSRAMADIGIANNWQRGSHAVSKDITEVLSQRTHSVKGGQVVNGKIRVSGSRLGSYSNSLQSMLDAVRATSADGYLCLTRDPKDWPQGMAACSDKKYLLYTFPSSLLEYGRARNWTQRTNRNGKTVYEYTGNGGAVTKASIVTTMSYQLWTEVDVSKLPAPTPIVVRGKKPKLSR